MSKNIPIFLVFLLSGFGSRLAAQNTPIGTWQTYLCYVYGQSLTESNQDIYMGFQAAVLQMSKTGTIEQYYTKASGLSDVGINKIRYDRTHNVLVIAYSNSDIDIVQGVNQVTNVPDVYLETGIGDYNIYDICITPQYVYFCCGFGILVYDDVANNIVDTYKPGGNGNNIKVTGMAEYNDTLYAATSTGLWYVSANNPNLYDYSQWKLVTAHAAFADTVKHVMSSKTGLWVFAADTVFNYTNGQWQVRHSAPKVEFISGQSDDIYTTYIVDSAGGAQHTIWAFDNNGGQWIVPPSLQGPSLDVIGIAPGQLWTVDDWVGWRTINSNGSSNAVTLPGPYRNVSFAMEALNGNLYVAGGSVNPAWNHEFYQNGFYEHNPATGWTNYNPSNTPSLNGYEDFICTTVSTTTGASYYGSFNKGLVEKTGATITNEWNASNSALQKCLGDTGSCRVGGLAFDGSGNLWVANHGSPNPLCVYTAAHEWKQMLPSTSLGTNYLGPLVIDNSNQIWAESPDKGGIVVYNYGQDLTTTSDDKAVHLGTGIGTGGLPDATVNCLALDQNGYVWVGTDEGVAVYYCPEQEVTGTGCDAQQIIYQVPGDSNLGYLLATEQVTSMAVDGANRKWFGTSTDGVYLMSSDGTIQVQHFTLTNSPLLSNTIESIAIDNLTGEVFFGTDMGLCSYTGDAITGVTTMKNVYVYPDPVRPDYTGPIVIRGTVANATIKITDPAGNEVWETQSLGGQATWDGNRLDGTRATSGVYIVYINSPDGTTSAVTKFVMIK